MRFFSLLVGFLAYAMSAQACGTCSRLSADGLLLPTDDALNIALKTREAVAADRLDADPEGIPLTAMARWLARRQNLSGLGTIHLIAVDTGEKCSVSQAPDGGIVSLDTSGAADTTIIVTRRTLQTVINGKMSWDQAATLQLARLEKTVPVAAANASTPD